LNVLFNSPVADSEGNLQRGTCIAKHGKDFGMETSPGDRL